MDKVLVTGGVVRLPQRVDVRLDTSDSISSPDVHVRTLSSGLTGFFHSHAQHAVHTSIPSEKDRVAEAEDGKGMWLVRYVP
jgi:hypothetical protein